MADTVARCSELCEKIKRCSVGRCQLSTKAKDIDLVWFE